MITALVNTQLLTYSASWSVTFNSHPTHYLIIYALEVDTQALPCVTSVSTWIRPPTVLLFFGSCSIFPNFQRHKTLTTVKNYILFFWHSMFHSLLLFCSVSSSFLLAAVQKFMVIVASRVIRARWRKLEHLYYNSESALSSWIHIFDAFPLQE